MQVAVCNKKLKKKKTKFKLDWVQKIGYQMLQERKLSDHLPFLSFKVFSNFSAILSTSFSSSLATAPSSGKRKAKQ